MMIDMNNKGMYSLNTDPQFRMLIRPLYKSDYKLLEESIISEGCIEPITTWHGYIVDGHNRYEICHRHNIPFSVREGDFYCREEVIACICEAQLKREQLPEELRHYLIGKQYESEKTVQSGLIELPEDIGKPYLNDANQPKTKTEIRMKISDRIARDNSISRATVEKYAIYTKAIDVIISKYPELAKNILSGVYKISHVNVIELSKLNLNELKKVQKKIEQMQQNSVKYHQFRNVLDYSVEKKKASATAGSVSVKDMPKYDPDAEVVGLTLTIPTWTRSIDRVMNKTNFAMVSQAAKAKLKEASCDMSECIDKLIEAIKEK